MGIAWRLALGGAAVSLILGILERLGVEALSAIVSPSAFLRFTDTCLLAAIACLMAETLEPRHPVAAEVPAAEDEPA
jgi:hypothetical protein